MKDETYAFISDVKTKGSVARSARNARTHCGKGGRVSLPSDNLSKKELMKMSGECKSYRLNDPMTWLEFISMPDDLKVTYIKLLRQKFNVPDKNIAEMFGVCKDHVCRTFKKLGLQRTVRTSHPKWDKEGFYAWVNGMDKIPTPVLEEEPVEDPVQEEQEVFVEDDLPFEKPDPATNEVVWWKPKTAVPTNGSMNFTCPANQALNTLEQLLGETNVSISVMWRVIDDGGKDNATD